MDPLTLILFVLLPLAPFLLFPARVMGRGGNFVVVGAVLVVLMMMALWFGLNAMTATVPDPEVAAPEEMFDFETLVIP
ncbi:MAG: hypothetical protein WEB63_03510 [Cucumibacter sp.]